MSLPWTIIAALPEGAQKPFLAQADRKWYGLGQQTAFLSAAQEKLAGEKEASAAPVIEHALTGRLYVSDKHDGEPWGMLAVPNALARGAFDAMNEAGAELPKNSEGLFNAHITVFRPEDFEQMGGASKLTERGHSFHYTLGQVKSVTPDNWDGVSKCWFIEVQSTELKNLRKSYGLTPLPSGDHQFHITIAIRKKGILRPNEVAKTAAQAPVPYQPTLADFIKLAEPIVTEKDALRGLWDILDNAKGQHEWENKSTGRLPLAKGESLEKAKRQAHTWGTWHASYKASLQKYWPQWEAQYMQRLQDQAKGYYSSTPKPVVQNKADVKPEAGASYNYAPVLLGGAALAAGLGTHYLYDRYQAYLDKQPKAKEKKPIAAAEIKTANWYEWLRSQLGYERRDVDWEKNTPGSSQVRHMLYKADPQELVVGYRGEGQPEYAYESVPPDTADQLRNASSPGAALWDHIRVRGDKKKHRFNYRRVN